MVCHEITAATYTSSKIAHITNPKLAALSLRTNPHNEAASYEAIPYICSLSLALSTSPPLLLLPSPSPYSPFSHPSWFRTPHRHLHIRLLIIRDPPREPDPETPSNICANFQRAKTEINGGGDIELLGRA